MPYIKWWPGVFGPCLSETGETGETMNEWNKVDECLPSIGAPVRVSSITSGITDGMFVHEDRKHNFLKWIVNGALCFDVTHWRAKDYPESPSADCKEDKREKCNGCLRFYCDTDGDIPYCHGLLALEGKCRLGGTFPEMAKGTSYKMCGACAFWQGKKGEVWSTCRYFGPVHTFRVTGGCDVWEQELGLPQEKSGKANSPFSVRRVTDRHQYYARHEDYTDIHLGLSDDLSVAKQLSDRLNLIWQTERGER